MTAHPRDGEVTVDELARRAADGDRDALSALVRELQHPMYRLALRFLGDPDDAQDACQEILIRIVTRLGTFEGRSKFTTWAYTVATRSLMRTRRRVVESSVQGAARFAALLDAGMGDIDTTIEEAEYRLLCEEVRISCTYGMLLCLSRPRARRVPARRRHRPHRRRGRRDPRVHPRRVPPTRRPRPTHPAPRHRQPLRPRRSRQPLPLRPPDHRRRAGRHPAARPPAPRHPPTRRGAGVDRTRRQATRRRRWPSATSTVSTASPRRPACGTTSSSASPTCSPPTDDRVRQGASLVGVTGLEPVTSRV